MFWKYTWRCIVRHLCYITTITINSTKFATVMKCVACHSHRNMQDITGTNYIRNTNPPLFDTFQIMLTGKLCLMINWNSGCHTNKEWVRYFLGQVSMLDPNYVQVYMWHIGSVANVSLTRVLQKQCSGQNLLTISNIPFHFVCVRKHYKCSTSIEYYTLYLLLLSSTAI